MIKRWLQYCNYEVDHVCNLTDVDDKIINKMISDNMTLQQVTDKYSNAFFDDLKVILYSIYICTVIIIYIYILIILDVKYSIS